MRLAKATIPLLLLFGTACAQSPALQGPAGAAALRVEQSERQIAVETFMNVTTEDVARAADASRAIVDDAGGFTQRSNEEPGSRINLSFRVPAESLADVLTELRTLGKVTHESQVTTDVTDEVVDLEARLENLVELRARLRGYLEEAESLEEIIAVESELARVQSEVESLTATLDRLRTRVAMSSLTLTLQRKRTLGPLGWVGYGLAWTLGKLFVIS